MEKDQSKDLGLFLLTSSAITGIVFLKNQPMEVKRMRERTQEEYENKVVSSRLYKSGNSFTLSDILGILNVSADYGRAIMKSLVNDGYLSQVESDTCISYSSSSKIRKILSGRLSGYQPPMSPAERRVSPWIRSPVRQERYDAVG